MPKMLLLLSLVSLFSLFTCFKIIIIIMTEVIHHVLTSGAPSLRHDGSVHRLLLPPTGKNYIRTRTNHRWSQHSEPVYDVSLERFEERISSNKYFNKIEF
jgi:hypothetical protein